MAAVGAALVAVASLLSKGLTGCSAWAPWLHLLGSRVQAGSCGTWALVAPRHVESSCTRDRTHVPCIGRRILNQWTNREIQSWFLLS